MSDGLRNWQYNPSETSSLRAERSPPSYGTNPVPPPYSPTHQNSNQGSHGVRVHVYRPSPDDHRSGSRGLWCFALILFIFLPFVMLNVYYSDLPTKISLLNETMARMREQENAMNREAKHLESERIGLRRESARLEKERLALESTTLKMEGERRALESTIHHLEQERLRVEEKKRLLEAERSRLEKEKRLLENERQSLENERQSLERQESALKEERERWEKVRDELTIPRGAFWEVVWPAWDCRAYGRREYWGILRNIPEGRSEVDACMNMPVEIKGVTIRRPYRCQYVDGSIHGFWMVDWDQPDCKPWHQNFVDGGCTNWGSGLRRIEAEVVGINDRGGQDWRLLCETAPMIWDHIVYTSPDHCLDRGRKIAAWEVPDGNC